MNGFQENSKTWHWIKFAVSQLLWNMDETVIKITRRNLEFYLDFFLLKCHSSNLRFKFQVSSLFMFPRYRPKDERFYNLQDSSNLRKKHSSWKHARRFHCDVWHEDPCLLCSLGSFGDMFFSRHDEGILSCTRSSLYRSFSRYDSSKAVNFKILTKSGKGKQRNRIIQRLKNNSFWNMSIEYAPIQPKSYISSVITMAINLLPLLLLTPISQMLWLFSKSMRAYWRHNVILRDTSYV